MRIASFNILHGAPVIGARTGTSGDLEQLITAAAELSADVLALQEVDVGQQRSGSVDQIEAVAAAVGARWWRFVPTLRGTPGPGGRFVPVATAQAPRVSTGIGNRVGPLHGIALMSRHPVLQWRGIRFDAPRVRLPLLVQGGGRARLQRVADEPRAAIAALVEGPRGPFTIVTAHLSFVPGVNIGQLRQLRAWMRELPRPLVLVGDFNLPGSVPSRVSRYERVLFKPTYPSYRPRVQFDHVLMDGVTRATLGSARDSASALPFPVSDHCAVSVDVDL